MYGGPSESVKHVKVVGQAHTKQLEQFQLEFVAAVGRGKWVDQARVDDGHGEYLTYAVNLLDKASGLNKQQAHKLMLIWPQLILFFEGFEFGGHGWVVAG